MNSPLHPLTAYRKRTGISLQKLAEKVGTTRQSLFRIEGGTQNPSFDLIKQIVSATDGEVTANDLVAASVSGDAA